MRERAQIFFICWWWNISMEKGAAIRLCRQRERIELAWGRPTFFFFPRNKHRWSKTFNLWTHRENWPFLFLSMSSSFSLSLSLFLWAQSVHLNFGLNLSGMGYERRCSLLSMRHSMFDEKCMARMLKSRFCECILLHSTYGRKFVWDGYMPYSLWKDGFESSRPFSACVTMPDVKIDVPDTRYDRGKASSPVFPKVL